MDHSIHVFESYNNLFVSFIHSLSTADLENGGFYALREDELRLEDYLIFHIFFNFSLVLE